jgi:DNA polymerase III subunit epsilon
MNHSIVVLDFETTGLSPSSSRVIEVAALRVDNGFVADSFVQLMHPGYAIPPFITSLTGITSAMVDGMPSPESVMPRLHAFIGGRTVVAHNASFDIRFLCAEMERAGISFSNQSLCTMRLARRLVPDLRGYSLGNLVDHLRIQLPRGEAFHRAMGDSMVTVELFNRLIEIMKDRHGIDSPEPGLLQALMSVPKRKVLKFLEMKRAGAAN